ncbi:EAL domain-containing protein [Leptolyngbya sp. FACHB-17]|uniref:bifunctional diguanylate cyclase/phosphodiesterase n=1 Tax=unclassified Leptolyngbya TaxID=2650499 RepID=UPI001681AEEA|nr:EAL domain-containing protein [Leptolyngbya sp. FACHB-17]MBD2078702.1 EAL domain-containing protein [Leptolyngbya sp. FACHB-17]
MAKQQPFPCEQVSPEDWEKTPESVKLLVESLIAGATVSGDEPRLIQFLDATPIGITVHNSVGKVVYINQAGRSLLGVHYAAQVHSERLSETFQLYQQGTQQLYPVDALPNHRALKGEVVWVDDIEIHHADRVIPLEVWATPMLDQQGQVRYAIATFQDISERKRSEAERKRRELEQQVVENTLLVSEYRYRQLVQAQTDLILRSLPDTTITFANDALCHALGRTLDQIVGTKWSSFVPQHDLEKLHCKIATLSPNHPIFESINQDVRANDQTGWTQWLDLGIFDQQGQLIEIQSVGRDVTALQEKILREQALNRVFQAIRNSLDLDTIFATATKETALLLKNLDCFVVQYLPEQEIWKYVAEFHHDPSAPAMIGLEIADAGNPFAEQLKQLQQVRVEDTSCLEDAINQENVRCLPGARLLIPLVIDGRIWGSFTIATTQQSLVWQDDQLELAQSVANQLEVAIQQANLYQQVQQELEERRRIETALRESESRFQKMADNVPGILYGYRLRPDGSDQFTYISSGFRDVYGFEFDAALQDPTVVWGLTHPDDAEQLHASVAVSYESLQTWQCQYRVITPAGTLKWLQGVARPTRQSNGDVLWDGLIVDISDRKLAEEALRESETRYRLLAENMNDLVCLHDLQGRYCYVSPSCEGLLGYRYDEMLGKDPYSFFHPDDRDYIHKQAHIPAVYGKPLPVTYRIRQKSGHYIWFETLTKPIVNAKGEIVQLQTTSRDVTERIQVQSQLKHDALHDALTGLPNRHLLIERLELAINRAGCLQDHCFAVLFLDLDRFKVINDSLGHLAGDQLLIAIAQKLQTTVRCIDLVARLGGDEFVILLDEIQDMQEAIHVAERIFFTLQTPLLIEEREVYTSASIGIVLGTKAYAEASDLLRDADIAMYRAKTNGKGRYEIFNASMLACALKHLDLENDLRRAIDNQEFVLHYQPIVALDTGCLIGFEALIRWQHPTQGLKLPGEFIAVAEETGLITRLDYWALRTACDQLARWQSTFPEVSGMKMSVNLSALDLRRSDLLEEIDRVLAQTRLQGDSLTLEITESMLIEDTESTIQLLDQIKERGIQISIDDFGTGYSSLSYLHRLPIDNLKVDRCFVHQIQSGKRDRQIVETIVALSNQLELNTIAEGIETQQQLERLRELGYKFGQGRLFSKALSQEAITTLLSSQRFYRADLA